MFLETDLSLVAKCIEHWICLGGHRTLLSSRTSDTCRLELCSILDRRLVGAQTCLCKLHWRDSIYSDRYLQKPYKELMVAKHPMTAWMPVFEQGSSKQSYHTG